MDWLLVGGQAFGAMRLRGANDSMMQQVEENLNLDGAKAEANVGVTIPSRGWGLVLVLVALWIGGLQLRRPLVDTSTRVDQAVGYSVDINLGSELDLLNLPEVGPSLVRSIVEYRELHGDFQRPEELLEVPGIGPQTLKQLVPYLSFPTPKHYSSHQPTLDASLTTP